MTEVIAFLLGSCVAYLVLSRFRPGRTAVPVDLEHGDIPLLMDLVRRAHGAALACLALGDHDPIWSATKSGLSVEVLDRAVAAARLAMGDGRNHVIHEGESIVATGDGRRFGAAVVFFTAELDADISDRVIADLRKIFADIGSHLTNIAGKDTPDSALPEWLVGGPESVEGLSFQLCEAVLEVSGRPSALVLRDSATQVASVVAVSAGTDRRLLGATVSPNCATGRACMSDVPIVGADSKELFGELRADRRRDTTGGVAIPLWDVRECIGAFTVFGEHAELDSETWQRVQWLVKNAGPRLGRAAALRSAENRAMTDELTGLPNRRALQRSMHDHVSGPCSLLCIDLDHFKALNDGFGHAAGDAALRHVAAIFQRELRAGDVPARIGGEEFALWLPGTTASKAMEVANRIRNAVRDSVLNHGGAEIRITCSIGVASIPESVSQVDNLLSAADVAMYRAKEAGRDRIEAAAPKGG